MLSCTKPGCTCRQTQKVKQPCQTPGCNWPVWHPCTYGKPDLFPKLLGLENKKPGKRTQAPRTAAHREAIARAQKARWDRVRAENAERDKKIVARYAEGNVSIPGLMKEFKLGRLAVANALKAGVDAGLITIRKPGHTLAKGAR